MIGITIGIGDGWEEAAETSAYMMERRTGCDCIVIKHDPIGLHHPSWLKTRIWDFVPNGVDEIFFFDADFLSNQPWNPTVLFSDLQRRFLAVPDVNSQAVFNECQRHGLPFPDSYINAGFFICGREHRPVLESVHSKFYPQYGSWLEQTGLNRALLESGTEVVRLPRTFNTLLWPGVDDYSPESLRKRLEINIHTASLGGDSATIKKVQKNLWGDEIA